MDTNEFTTETPETNFGVEIAKSFALSTAVTAGSLAGFVAIGYAYTKVQDIVRKRKNAKKLEEN
jgi:hypothetical protein